MALNFIVLVILALGVESNRSVRYPLLPLFTTNNEEVFDVPVHVSRGLPTWLRGIYIRNGPACFGMGPRNFTHAFDGYAKLHSFRFDGSRRRFYFSSRFLQTNFYKDSRNQHDVAHYLLFDNVEPPFSSLGYLESLFNGIDNTNINAYKWKKTNNSDTFVALSDFWHFYEFDSGTLDTIGRRDPQLPKADLFTSFVPVPSTAHPIQEFGSDDYISFYELINPIPGFPGSLNLIRIKSVNERELISTIPLTEIPYMHSFGLTKRYAILFAHPIYFELGKMLKTRSPLKSLVWKEEKETDVFVIDINSGDQIHLRCPAMFFLHVANSYESPDEIIVDASTYSNLVFFKSLNFDVINHPDPRLPENAFPSMKRFIINLDRRAITINDFPHKPGFAFANKFDLPIINPIFTQKRHCFIYGLGVGKANGSLSPTYIIKKDVCRNGRNDRVWMKDNHYVTEPWFEPRPEAKLEDDGIIISLAMNTKTGESYLLFLDGRTLRYIGRGKLPTRVTFTIHGRMFHEHTATHDIVKNMIGTGTLSDIKSALDDV